jgi:hypothetical protein
LRPLRRRGLRPCQHNKDKERNAFAEIYHECPFTIVLMPIASIATFLWQNGEAGAWAYAGSVVLAEVLAEKKELRWLPVVERERAAVGVGRWRHYCARIREQQKRVGEASWSLSYLIICLIKIPARNVAS